MQIERDDPTEPTDIPTGLQGAVLALNNRHHEELSFLDPARLHGLLRQAFYARHIGAADAFMLALDEHADYDSPHYGWVRARYPRFVYVDRIVVGTRSRGRGHARRLYADLIRRAADAGHDFILCEVNSHPPNPASDALHASLGFCEVGAAAIRGGEKRVRYLALTIS